MSVKQLNFLHVKGLDIFKQLEIEEALLRISSENWCIVNEGSTSPAIILGISRLPEEDIFLKKSIAGKVRIIRRFSGGGTVYVDKDTLFVTFILNKNFFKKSVSSNLLMQWSAHFYKTIFGEAFKLCENDYVVNDRKIGGNAQYITRNRCLHHTSFLWDYNKYNMSLLKFPKKVPAYRNNRDHLDFISTLKGWGNKAELTDAVHRSLSLYFDLNHVSLTYAKQYLSIPHRKTLSIFTEPSLS